MIATRSAYYLTVKMEAVINKRSLCYEVIRISSIYSKSKKWRLVGVEGSHYIYENERGKRYSVPFHGAKEIPEPLRKKIVKEMDL